MTKSELELAENLAGAKYPEQYVLVMQDLLRKLLEERERLDANDTWVRDQLGRLNRWASEQNAGNAFASQVGAWALAVMSDLDELAEEREP